MRTGLARTFAIGMAATAALLFAQGASAQSAYPAKPVKLIVPYAAGGVVDTLGRLIASQLSGELGQPIIVENHAGASGTVGTGVVARAPADGYTLLLVYDTFPVAPHLLKSLSYDINKDFAPITLIGRSPVVALASKDFAPNDIAELVSYAKAHPGEVKYGSSGVGSSSHLTGELFDRLADIHTLHVPYKGGTQVQTDLIGGHLDLFWGPTAFAKLVLPSGRVKLLGQTGTARSPDYPDVKTLAEQGFGNFVAYSWVGLSAPANTPPAIIQRWNEMLAKAARTPEFSRQLHDAGYEVVMSSPTEFAQMIKADSDRWGKVIRDANISGE